AWRRFANLTGRPAKVSLQEQSVRCRKPPPSRRVNFRFTTTRGAKLPASRNEDIFHSVYGSRVSAFARLRRDRRSPHQTDPLQIFLCLVSDIVPPCESCRAHF